MPRRQLSHLIAPGPFCDPPTEEALKAHPVLVGLNLYPDQMNELLQKRDRALLVTEGMR